MLPRVLYVSKPIAPPFHDGTKCLIRDVARSVSRVHPQVMSTPSAPAIPGVEMLPVYGDSGGFSPALTQNARAALYLMARAKAPVWHFAFAPNKRSSSVGKFGKGLRKASVVQTIASAPKSFDDIRGLFFGDIVVAQSRDTANRLASADASGHVARVEVIPPPVGDVRERSDDEKHAARAAIDVSAEAPMFVYPGDLEVSCGAEFVASMVEPLHAAVPNAIVVFACRAKTPEAPRIQQQLAARLPAHGVRFVGEVDDFISLLAASDAVLFPVDDLYGKVDLPIALLESMALGVPVFAADHGTLRDLHGARRLPFDTRQWVEACQGVASRSTTSHALIAEQYQAVEQHFKADVVARQYEDLYLELVAARAGGTP